MSFKEVSEHRKAGRLDEALKIALKDYEEAQTSLVIDVESPQGDKKPENIPANLIWPKRALAWVYYEFLKKHYQPASFEIFKENLIKIKELQLPEDEKMVFDNCAWQIGSMVFTLQKNEPVDYKKINELFEIIKDFHFTKPSEAYSFIYKAFHKGYQNWSRYLEFADWWNFEYFRSEDYLKEEFKEQKLMAIVEQAYIAYSKKLLEGEPEDIEQIRQSKGQLVQALLKLGGNLEQLQKKVVNKTKIIEFLPRINSLIEKHPEYQYPPFFKAKLLLASGSDENIFTSFLPFARQKRNDFWVWELMAEIFQDDKELQFASYCKALSLKTPEDFLVKIRQAFAIMLIERKMYPEARTEIEKVIATRSKHDWKLPAQIINWTEQDWYKAANAQKDNKKLYLQYAINAEEILFQDIQEEIVAVEFVNENKKILNFVQSKEKHGFFKYAGLIEKPRTGDILNIRFSDYQKDGFCKVFTAKTVDPDTKCDAIKSFIGEIKIIPPHNIGFVEDVFVEPRIVNASKLTDKHQVSGKAILSFNKKKNEWGWKAFNI